MTAVTRKKLVILGGGFASLQVARRVSKRDFDVTLVSPRDHFLFTPLLASASVGTVNLDSITESLARLSPNVRYLRAEADSVDLERSTVRCISVEARTTFELDYEYLIIAVGAATKTFGVAGVPEFAIPLKDAADAWTIRQKVLDRFHTAALPSLSDDERRKLLSFVVVGGGPTGVEFAAELHDLIADDLRATRPDLAELASVTLLEAGPDILSSFHERLRSYTRRHYDRQGITVRLHSPVKEVLSDAVVLASGERIDAGLTVWSAGVTSVEFVNRLPVRKDAAGRVLTDRCLRMVDHPRIFAAGDCAAVESVVYPMTGQLAQQQGKYLGKALHRIAKGRAPRPFRYFHQGMLTYVGGQRALAETPGGRLRGWIAWLMWRAIYLTKLVSLRNKVQVLTDWIRSHVFGRELSSY